MWDAIRPLLAELADDPDRLMRVDARAVAAGSTQHDVGSAIVEVVQSGGLVATDPERPRPTSPETTRPAVQAAKIILSR